MEIGGGDDDHDEHGLMLSLSLRSAGSCGGGGGGGHAAAATDHVVLNIRSCSNKEEEEELSDPAPIIIHPIMPPNSDSGSLISSIHQQYHHHHHHPRRQQQQQQYYAPAAAALNIYNTTSSTISTLPHDHHMSLIIPSPDAKSPNFMKMMIADHQLEAEKHIDQLGSILFQPLQMGTSMVAAANNDQLRNYIELPNFNHKYSSINTMTMMKIQKNDHRQQHGEEDQLEAAAAVSSPNNSSSVSCLSLNACTTTITTGRKRNSNKLQYYSSSSSSDQEPEQSDQHKLLDVNHDQNIIDDDQELMDGGKLKKLRLSKDQAAILEERFRDNNTLNPKQKIALAKQLNLRPRQVEVWFQNRRARTKLKQTEVDCDLLRRCCENLSEENRRLQREILELRSLRHTQQLYMQQQQQEQLTTSTTLTVCPYCDRRQAVSDANPASHLISPWRPATAPNNYSIGNQQPTIRPQAKS